MELKIWGGEPSHQSAEKQQALAPAVQGLEDSSTDSSRPQWASAQSSPALHMASVECAQQESTVWQFITHHLFQTENSHLPVPS